MLISVFPSMCVSGILLQAAALFPTAWGLCKCPVPTQECSHRTSPFQSRLGSKYWLPVLQRVLCYHCTAHTQIKKNSSFPRCYNKNWVFKHRLSSSALILRSEHSARADRLCKKAQALVGNASSDWYIHVALLSRLVVIKWVNMCVSLLEIILVLWNR